MSRLGIPFERFNPKDWPKYRSKPCRHCGAPEWVTRRGRARMRNPLRHIRKDSKWYWIIGYTLSVTPCKCDGRVQATERTNRIMERLNGA
jgi:hypothetical protein